MENQSSGTAGPCSGPYYPQSKEAQGPGAGSPTELQHNQLLGLQHLLKDMAGQGLSGSLVTTQMPRSHLREWPGRCGCDQLVPCMVLTQVVPRRVSAGRRRVGVGASPHRTCLLNEGCMDGQKDGWMDDEVLLGALQWPNLPVGARAELTDPTQKFSLENQRSAQTRGQTDKGWGRGERACWSFPCSE